VARVKARPAARFEIKAAKKYIMGTGRIGFSLTLVGLTLLYQLVRGSAFSARKNLFASRVVPVYAGGGAPTESRVLADEFGGQH
jgi:hypothetical protein